MKQYFKNIWTSVWTVLVGMKITILHMFTKSVTIQYPDERLQLPERERNRLFVNMDDCIGCDQCARACPVSCINLETFKAVPGDIVGRTGVTSNGKKKALFVPTFTIDIAKCCYCQLCVYPCPTECIYMTDVYEFSEFERSKLIYEFSDMTKEQIEEKKAKLVVYNKEQEEKKAAAAKAAAEAKAKAAAEAKDKPVEAKDKPVEVKDKPVEKTEPVVKNEIKNNGSTEVKPADEKDNLQFVKKPETKSEEQAADIKQTAVVHEKQEKEGKKESPHGKVPLTTKTEPVTEKKEEDKKE